jgi:hypothetical protein
MEEECTFAGTIQHDSCIVFLLQKFGLDLLCHFDEGVAWKVTIVASSCEPFIKESYHVDKVMVTCILDPIAT